MKKQLFFVLALIGLMLMGGGINAYADLASYTNNAKYHKPSPSPGTDYEVIYTTQTNMEAFYNAGWASDGNGAAAWKLANRTINNWIDPTTDLAGEGTFPTEAVQYGIQFKKDGYKGVYFFVTGCSKIKAYMAGFSSRNNKLQIEAVNKDNSSDKPSITADTECAMNEYCCLELSLDKEKKYRVRILDSNGNDAQLYALRLYGDYVTQSFSLTTADTEPYTLYLDYPVTIPEGIEAYTGTLDAKEETLTMKEVEGTIPANTAVIVKSATAGPYVFKETSTAASIESNSLKGVTADTDITELVTTGKTLLTLGTKGGKVAFRKPATGTTQVKANKAYLLVNTPSGEGAKTVKMIFDGETTGISEFTANEDATNAPLFNLNGQRVNANAKGLLIKNGKKIIIK